MRTKSYAMEMFKTNTCNKLDRDAFCTLYRDYQQVLFKKLLALPDSREAVKNIIQEVFLKIWLRRKQIKMDASLKNVYVQDRP